MEMSLVRNLPIKRERVHPSMIRRLLGLGVACRRHQWRHRVMLGHPSTVFSACCVYTCANLVRKLCLFKRGKIPYFSLCSSQSTHNFTKSSIDTHISSSLNAALYIHRRHGVHPRYHPDYQG
jgi:hypothetical protein